MDTKSYKLSYPIGEFSPPKKITSNQIDVWVEDITQLPKQLEQVLAKLRTEQLNKPYRPNGWTGHQVVHHIADSHMNAFIRFSLTLTEDTPSIRPYLQDEWMNLSYINATPIQLSVDLIRNLHAR